MACTVDARMRRYAMSRERQSRESDSNIDIVSLKRTCCYLRLLLSLRIFSLVRATTSREANGERVERREWNMNERHWPMCPHNKFVRWNVVSYKSTNAGASHKRKNIKCSLTAAATPINFVFFCVKNLRIFCQRVTREGERRRNISYSDK